MTTRTLRFWMVFLAAAIAAPAAPAGDDGQPKLTQAALRVAEDGDRSVRLEIVRRRYQRADGEGPDVTLVGVAHIADGPYYRELQRVLSEFDVVLYESVMPPGARGASGADDVERRASTDAAMRFIASALEAHRTAHRAYPEDLASAAEFAGRTDDRVTGWMTAAARDAWGGTVRYERRADEPGFDLTSYGADGTPGGDGAAADIVIRSGDVPAADLSGDGGLQEELARALGLSFQLEAMDYDGDNWRCSDMTIDELQRALVASGSSLSALEAAMGSGSQLSVRITKALLRLMRLADAFFDGAITDMIKVLMIEMLGDEDLIRRGLLQFDQGFNDVILNQRNQVVIDDLAKLVADEPATGSIAIFYGAAHLRDMADRLREQLDYRAIDEAWLPAIEVNLTTSAIPAEDLRQLRALFRSMISDQ